MQRSLIAMMILAVLTASPAAAEAVSDVPVTLRGSLSAMQRQHGVAVEQGYPFVRTPAELVVLEEEGALVRLRGNADYGFREGVRSMLARPEMQTFIERLAAEYRAGCEEKLVVTSLTRPASRQPRNAHRLSVHPAGIAVDLRVSRSAPCRQWLEARLLEMEEGGLLDVTRERTPPHYHVALFPSSYMAHVTPILEAERERAARARAAHMAAGPLPELVAAPAEAGGRAWGLLAFVPAALLAAAAAHRRAWRAAPEPCPGRAGRRPA